MSQLFHFFGPSPQFTLVGDVGLGNGSMGIEVQLRTETGEVVDEVGDPQLVLARATQNALSATRLLKYLVPWGDAVFNQAQAADLEDDIRGILLVHAGSPLGDMLSNVRRLVGKLSADSHLYLWFMGD